MRTNRNTDWNIFAVLESLVEFKYSFLLSIMLKKQLKSGGYLLSNNSIVLQSEKNHFQHFIETFFQEN